jgi:parvulin-like peptidyl-prolyl isomerase
MAKKTPETSQEKPPTEGQAATEDSNINHINNLISNVDEDEEFLVETEESNYKPKNEAEINKDIEQAKPTAAGPAEEKPSKPAPEAKQKEDTAAKPVHSTKKSISQTGATKDKRPHTKPSTTKKIRPVITQRHKSAPQKAMPKKIEHMRSKMVKQKHETKRKSDKISVMTWVWVGIAIIVIVVASVLLFKNSYVKPVDNQTVNQIAATVNGEAIYLSDIEKQYNNLNPAMQRVYTKETILNQTINELLLIQETKEKGIMVDKSEVDAEIENFKAQNNFDDTQLKAVLAGQNITIDDLRNLVEKRLKVRDLLNLTILSNIEISDAQIKEYYDANIDQFKQPERVRVSHILILTGDNVTDEDAKAKIDNIESMTKTADFCELASEYSEDPGSKDNCGMYTFGKGEMVPEFEDASFKLSINQTAKVQTMYGWHLIKKLESLPPMTTPVDQVSAQIKGVLFDEQAQKNFDEYLNKLREDAVIVNYMVDAEGDNQETGIGQPMDVASIQSADNPDDAPTQPQDDADDETKVTTTTPTTVTADLDDFAKCLTEKGIKFYGAYWCPHCENNKKLFGDAFQYVTYVECADADNPQIQTPACESAGIEGYPTWIVNGQKYPGEQSIERLAQLSGCRA